jgi:hypothetical protein
MGSNPERTSASMEKGPAPVESPRGAWTISRVPGTSRPWRAKASAIASKWGVPFERSASSSSSARKSRTMSGEMEGGARKRLFSQSPARVQGSQVV